MNKNGIKKLADNPHYSMSDSELEELANILAEEAEEQKAEERKETPKINKNRVKKSYVKLDKTPALKEVDEDDASE